MNSKTDSQTPIDPAKAQKSAVHEKMVGFGLILIALLIFGYFFLEGMNIMTKQDRSHYSPLKSFHMTWGDVIARGVNLVVITPLLVGIYFYRRGARQLKKVGQSSSKVAS